MAEVTRSADYAGLNPRLPRRRRQGLSLSSPRRSPVRIRAGSS